uniref:Elongation factor 1-gamma n=1 Tax=Ciona savignyi TaxID=51511 RepID=H2ZJ30_CIOSA
VYFKHVVMDGTLYTYPDNFRAQKIQIAAKYSGVKLELAQFVAGQTNKSDEFLKKFPLGRVPAYENGDLKLFEANAIAYHVGNETTRGTGNESEVLQWIGVAENDLLPAACTWVYPTLGIMQYNKQATEKAKQDVKDILLVLNNRLLNFTYLVGERITQADITMACTLLMLYKHVMDPEFRAPFKNVNRWFTTLINQAEFKSVLGDVNLCVKMAQFDSKKFNEVSGKGGKKEPTPKKPAEKKEKAAGDSTPQNAVAPAVAEKRKDPWADAPKPSFDMDAWKRYYSNKESDESLQYFQEHFPKDTYSVWRGKYKYNGDLERSFMASNLIGGMFQRLEKLRKHAFASVCVFGEDKEKNLEIDGIWIWLGHELAFTLTEDWQIDYESFEWTKLEYNDNATQKMIKEFWAWEGDFDGRKFNSGKIYK